ncbi:MAG: flavodoxin family protein [Actinomycetota bacterium]|nr:MAG: flavodoxin family protein [Actinomycetota bacterium]
MKALVVYDSQWGNTERIARATGGALGAEPDVLVLPVGQATLERLIDSGLDLLVVGSPTQGFRPTKPVAEILQRLPEGGLDGVAVAAFDTRFKADEVESRLTRFVVRRGGYAGPRIAAQLEKAGGTLAAPPEGFFVVDKEGPLREGELGRAAAWGEGLGRAR